MAAQSQRTAAGPAVGDWLIAVGGHAVSRNQEALFHIGVGDAGCAVQIT